MTTSAWAGVTTQASTTAAKANAAKREIDEPAFDCGRISTVAFREECSVVPTGRRTMPLSGQLVPRVPPETVPTRLPSLYLGWLGWTIKLRADCEAAW